MQHNILLVHSLPFEAGGPAERSLSWLKARLSERGLKVTVARPSMEPTALQRAIDACSLVVVGALRPGPDLALAGTLANCSRPIVIHDPGYGFCAIGSRACSTCVMSSGCPSSDRVAIYRRLVDAAALLVYGSPLHQRASEEFVGSHPDKSIVTPPPTLPEFPRGDPAGDQHVAFVHPQDPDEWVNLLAYAYRISSTGDPIRIIGKPPSQPGPELPLVSLRSAPPNGAAKLSMLAQAKVAVCLPSRPLPFGADVLAVAHAGRSVVVNKNVGWCSFAWDARDASVYRRHAAEQWSQVLDAIVSAAAVGNYTRRTAQVVAHHPLLWCHRLGLGDSINILPFARALAQQGSLTWVLPARHAALLRGHCRAEIVTDEEFDIEDARAKHDLIVEVSVAMRTAYERFYSGDILGERWIRIDLAHQANAYHSVYENLLSLLARAGMSPLVGPPRITTSASLTEAARTRLGNVGIDPDEDLVISLHPGSGRAFKCWPARSFGALARELQESLGAKIVLVIGREEHALLNELALDGVCCELVSDEDSLTQVQGLLAQSTLHVGNDSGLTHLAVACGTPVVALFGPTDPGKWGPAHGLRRVVIARDSSGRRSKRMRSITVPEVHDAIASLLRDVVRERPRCASMKLRQHPQAQRVDAGWATRGARLEAPGESGSILTALATMCERGAAWSALVQRFGEDLCEVASASEVITQAWAANDTVVHALTPRPRVESIGTPPPRVAYVVESGFQHAFGVIAMLAVMPGRVFTSGTRIGDRLSSLAEVVVLNNDREIGAALADHGVDVVVSTSQRIKPASLRDAAGRRKVVFIGHGESDKTRGQGPTPGPGFVHARVNEEFDLVLVASHFHMARHRNPRRRLVGYMKHDLFVRDGYSQRRPRNGWILWAPGWGRHSSLEPWLDRVLDVSQRLGLSCMLHPHPHSYEAEPRLIQRVQAEVIRHRHFSIAHCANVLDAMAQCEVMLGDVSSVGYDWLMFDRPAIVLDHPGLSVDDERSLFGTGACVTSCTGLERALREAAAAPDKQGALRRAALEERFFSLDGCAAERARDAILELWAAPSRG